MPDALIVYYSYTHQTAKAATAIAEGLTEIGWRPRLAPLEFADGPLEFPLRPLAKRANELSNASLRGDLVLISFDETIVDQRWDPPVTMGVRLVSIAGDGLQHAGQAAYVRGLLGM